MPSKHSLPGDVELSMFISSVLRHRLDEMGFVRDAQGWINVEDLLVKSAAEGQRFTREDLLRIVAESPKQRFALSEDGRRVRANQGHSVQVDLGLADQVPPPVLFHGTASRFLASIMEQGLLPQERHAVHLSGDAVTAATVGCRYGRVVILEVDTVAMLAAGHRFQRTNNGVWLTDRVPAVHLRVGMTPESTRLNDPDVRADEKPRVTGRSRSR